MFNANRQRNNRKNHQTGKQVVNQANEQNPKQATASTVANDRTPYETKQLRWGYLNAAAVTEGRFGYSYLFEGNKELNEQLAPGPFQLEDCQREKEYTNKGYDNCYILGPCNPVIEQEVTYVCDTNTNPQKTAKRLYDQYVGLFAPNSEPYPQIVAQEDNFVSRFSNGSDRRPTNTAQINFTTKQQSLIDNLSLAFVCSAPIGIIFFCIASGLVLLKYTCTPIRSEPKRFNPPQAPDNDSDGDLEISQHRSSPR